MARLPSQLSHRVGAILAFFIGCQAASPLTELTRRDDAVGLVQQSVQSSLSAPNAAPDAAPDAAETNEEESQVLFYEAACEYHPMFCQPPFECHRTTKASITRMSREGVARKGRPNYQAWCANADYEPFATKCAAGDLVGAGKIQYQLTTAKKFGKDNAELDASHCFMDGHCANTEVTNETTLEEAIKMCDKKFGRHAWTHFGRGDTPPEDKIGFGMGDKVEFPGGFTDPTQTRPFMLAACAMGNYHCDVMYCKNYCDDEHWAGKYGHLAKKFGWTK